MLKGSARLDMIAVLMDSGNGRPEPRPPPLCRPCGSGWRRLPATPTPRCASLRCGGPLPCCRRHAGHYRRSHALGGHSRHVAPSYSSTPYSVFLHGSRACTQCIPCGTIHPYTHTSPTTVAHAYTLTGKRCCWSTHCTTRYQYPPPPPPSHPSPTHPFEPAGGAARELILHPL